ncbi:MAG TPA: ABC transporter ATP-binding protein [Chloroflexota bacterium]|nr:ABC transporter ATP-binding protein [Chloroflexota bacterium]
MISAGGAGGPSTFSSGGRSRFGGTRLSMREKAVLTKPPLVTLKRLGRVLADYKGRLILAVTCVLVTSGMHMVMPWAFKHVIDHTIPSRNTTELLWIGALLIFMQAARHLLSLYERYLVALISQQMVYRLAKDLFEHMQRLSLRFFERWGTGEIISRTTNDIGVLQQAVSGGTIRAAISTVNMLGFGVIMALLNWQLALLAYATVPLLYYASTISGDKLRVRYRAVQERVAEVNNVLQENITGVRVAKAFAREGEQRRRFATENRGTLDANMSTAGVQAVASPAIQMISALGTAAILGFGSWQIVHGTLTVGALVAFVSYLVQFYQPVEELIRVNNTAQQALSAAERIFEFVDEQPDVIEQPRALDLQEVAGAVAFENVTFAYDPGKPVLHGVSMTADPGQVIALVGHTGSGKTTCVNLIPRFYDPDSGRVTLDGHDLRDLTLRSIRRQTAIVIQETFLFGATAAENIRYGKLDATRDEIVAAAKQAHADEFLALLPDGYDSFVGEGGVLLSRGQRQRIALARAILKDPRILILDEATSDVDTETEVLIQRALENVMRGRTTFVIAHRLSTIRNAHQIIVLDHGVIMERGTHSELLSHGGHYAELYQAQFAGQEEAQRRIDQLVAATV